ncbi:MAG: 23S rRNA (adenine(2503)-C(2))-methyltransferase RlmN [Phycisphaerae bacterium]
MSQSIDNTHLLGMTLADYSVFRGKHRQALRDEYRAMMRAGAGIALPPVTRRTDDGADGTVKFCLGVESAAGGGPALETESVIIPMTSFGGTRWYTLCISSQVGCRMACSFCETGRMGLLQNLTAGQIVRQRLVARAIRLEGRVEEAGGEIRKAKYFADGIQNIVFMGMGEPLDNFENVVQAIRVFTEPAGLDFPHGQITVSTVGRVDGLRKLAEICRSEPVWRNLRIAISLNAANDKLRNELMPVNKAMPLAELKGALVEYPLAPKARFLIEYVLIKGVNDSRADAEAVIDFCRDLPCIVNLIPYNPQRFATYETPEEPAILAFLNHLKERGIFTKRRVTHGRELMGACGQLGNPEVRRNKRGRGLPVLGGEGA